MHLVIIDAMNLIRRIHAAQPDATNLVQTCEQSCRAINKIIQTTQPSHILAVFDCYDDNAVSVNLSNWRTKLLPNYKQGRTPPPPQLVAYIDQIQEAFWQLGIDSLDSIEDEADDLIATIAVKACSSKQRLSTTIISTDKGYCQLLSLMTEQPQINLQIRDYFQKRWLDVRFVQQHFAVQPQQLLDFWALTGVPSLKIPGVPGIGAKTAAMILQQYGDIDTLFAQEYLPEKWLKRLKGNEEIAQICKQVVTLKTDLQLGFSLKDLRYNKKL